MDIVGLIVNLVAGAIGGNLSGAALKDKSLGAIGNTIAGAIGGAAGAYILKAVGLITAMGLADMSVGAMATEGGISLICGGIVTAIIGAIKNKMRKQ